MREILLLPDPAESSGGAGAPSGPRTEPQAAPPSASTPAVVSPVAHPSPPPAAQTVLQGEVTEETLRLRKELDDERTTRKRVEQEHAAVTDEFTRYKATVEEPKPVPVRGRPSPARSSAKPEKTLRLGRFV